MQFEEQVVIAASVEKVFSLYADVKGWSSWDPDVKTSSIDGAFVSGAGGTLQPSSGRTKKEIGLRLFTCGCREMKYNLRSCRA